MTGSKGIRRPLRSLLAALATAALTSTAWAEPSAADRETARDLMTTGRAKREAGDLKGALQAFTAADALMGVPTTGFEVAKTEAALGMLVEARDLALRVARSTVAPNEPPPFADARRNAEALAAELEQREPSIKVVPSVTPADLVLMIDGATVPTAAVGLPRKVNPGEHTVVVRVAGGENHATVRVAERQNLDVPIAVPNALANPDASATVESPHRSSVPTALAVAGLSVGALGLGLGVVTGLMSLDKTSTLKQACPNGCPASQADALSSARTLAVLSDVGFVVGGLGVAAGVTGLVIMLQQPKATAAIQPWIGVASAGVAGRF